MAGQANDLVKAVMKELDQAGRLTHEVLNPPRAESTTDPFAHMPYSEFVKERNTSQVNSVIDYFYCPPSWNAPGCMDMVQRLQTLPDWDMFEYFSFLTGKTLANDALDTQANYLRAILSFIRDTAFLHRDFIFAPQNFTSELATTRLLTALANMRTFRGRMHRMRTGDLYAHREAFAEVVAYICYDHGDARHCRAAKPRQRRRVAVPDDVPLPHRPPSPPADPAPHPPLYRPRLHRATLEQGEPNAWDGVVFAAYSETTRLKDEPDALAHHVAVVQSVLTRIRTKESVPTPYFESISDADLRAAFERDPAFATELEELKVAVTKPVSDTSLYDCVRRLVNHLCQPRKRTRATTRSVRFAPC